MNWPGLREKTDMTILHNQIAKLAQRCIPVLTKPQLEKIMTQATPEAKPAAPPWYVALWRICTKIIGMVVSGTALGTFFVAVAHYTGLDD